MLNQNPVAEVKLSGETKTRFFQRSVRFTMPNHTTRIFPAGLQEVPVEFADDPWLKDMGMSEYTKGEPLPPLMQSAPPGSHAHAATVNASGNYDATFAPRQFSTELDPVGEAANAENAVVVAEAQLEVLRDRAAALRGVADKYLSREAERAREAGVPANTGATDEGAGKGSRPVDGDINPRTGNPYTQAALEKAQAAYDEAE